MRPVSLWKVNGIMITGVLACIILFYGRPVLIPLTFGIMLAMLLTPVSNKLETKKINRIFSSIISVFIVLIFIAFLVFIVFAQSQNIAEDAPAIQQKIEKIMLQGQTLIEEKFGIPPSKQIEIIKRQSKSMMQNAGSSFTSFFKGLMDFFVGLLLALVFMFLFILQRDKYEVFFIKIHKSNDADNWIHVIQQITKVSQQYLIGRLLSIIFITILYTIGLSIIGLKNAFLLSAIASILTIIPYVGPFIGGFFPVAMAFVTGDPNTALAAIIVIGIVQLLDNYFVEPYVVGGEVSLSAITTIFAIVAGGYVWGIAGMVLFIPMIGILKIIFDNVDGLKPFGYLIGDQKKENKWSKKIKELAKSIKDKA